MFKGQSNSIEVHALHFSLTKVDITILLQINSASLAFH